MVHIDEPPPSYEAVVERLRPGDVLTHCFRPFPNAPVDGHGQVKPALLAARQRGVLFDIGHGMGSFSLEDRARDARGRVRAGHDFLRRACALHRRAGLRSGDDAVEVSGPRHAAATTSSPPPPSMPPKALNRPELGTFKPGSVGDASILELREGEFPLEDVRGEVVTAERTPVRPRRRDRRQMVASGGGLRWTRTPTTSADVGRRPTTGWPRSIRRPAARSPGCRAAIARPRRRPSPRPGRRSPVGRSARSGSAPRSA